MFNPFNFGDWADTIVEWYSAILSTLILALGQNTMPSEALFQNAWFLTATGGTIGLGVRLVGLFIIVMGLYAILRPTRSHSGWISGMTYGTVVLVFFGVLVIPIYLLLSMVSDAVMQIVTALATGDATATTADLSEMLREGNFPDHFAGKLFSAGFSAFFVALSLVIAWTIHITVVASLIFYPIAAAFAGSKWGRRIIDAFNATILTAVVVGPLMVFVYVLPAVLPGADNTVWRAISSVVSGIIAVVLPIALWWLTFRGSSEVTGRVTATMNDKLEAITSSSSVNTSINVESESRSGVISTFSKMTASDTGNQTMDKLRGEDASDLRQQLSRITIDSVTAATVATGHPYIGAVIKAADGIHQSRKAKESEVK